MNVYRIELCVIDFDGLGLNRIKQTLENTRFPNDCINPSVQGIESRDIGPWDDDHPLNKRDARNAAFASLFTTPAPAVEASEDGFLPLPEASFNGYSDGSEPLYTVEQVQAAILADRAARQVPAAPRDCSGNPSCCPDNEGRGCYCADNEIKSTTFDTSIKDDVIGIFHACGFEMRDSGPFAVCGSIDSAALVIEAMTKSMPIYATPTAPVGSIPSGSIGDDPEFLAWVRKYWVSGSEASEAYEQFVAYIDSLLKGQGNG